MLFKVVPVGIVSTLIVDAVVALTLAFFAAVVAGDKGHRIWLWRLGVISFTIIALLAAVGLSDRKLQKLLRRPRRVSDA
ncbi:MAG: hypothetical protein OXG65_16790 [Chloroflexi bacterium]|nr:hypothetical protein [Chloroflexota bacterium]